MSPTYHRHKPALNAQPMQGDEHSHTVGHHHPHPAPPNPAQVQLGESAHAPSQGARGLTSSVLGWPAWQRVLVVLPVLLLLWLAVAWASREVQPW